MDAAQIKPNGAPPVRVLMVEDVATDAELEIRELKRAGLRVVHRLVDDEAAFLRALTEFDPNIIISDFSMPHFDGMAALALARDAAPEVPFIFVSGTIGEEYAIRALRNGATDYVLKNNLVRLPAAIERALHDARDRRARRKAEKKLAEARERLESIYEAMPDMLWSVELPSERLAYVSPAANAIFGQTAEAFLSDPDFWINVVHAEDRPAVLEAWQQLQKGAPFDIEYRAVRPDGSTTWIHDRGRVIRDAAGAAVRIDGLARDISEAVRQRERLARLGRIRDLLSAANSAFMRIRERRPLFEEFCRIAVARGGFVLARVVELDPAGKLSVGATTEESPGAFQLIVDGYNRDPQRAQSLLAQAVRSRQVTVSNDMRNDKRVESRGKLTEENNYSLVILPVRAENAVVAAAILRAREPNFFDQEELALLSEMVANLEFALELQAKQEKLNYLALYDPLTELPNRTLFQDRLTQAIEASRRSGTMLSLTVFDIERFKAINDTFGQHAGDEVLRALARRLHGAVGDLNRVARLGGNMFAVMRPAIQDAADAARILDESAAEIVGRAVEVEGREIQVTAKAGIALFPDDGTDADALFRNAEASLKRAKETGDKFLFYAPHINARVAEQVELEGRLRRAVEQRELFLHYQPKVDMVSKRIVGLEALMRWRGPDNLLMSPARFVPVLEETGLIQEAGRQALEIAATIYREWKAQGLQPPRIAVNVSALQLRQRSFVDDVRDALGGPDNGVDLEVTESLLMQDIEESIRKLRSLREQGANISLDDFGTGHSSLAYLSRLPIDTVKIDRSFVHAMTSSADATSIVSTIISLAQALRLKVVAEGVETEEQAQLLRLLRCDQMQGYLFSPPQPREKIEELLRNAAA
ncbi:MAG TPA: EAL domain-containing protein [Burkholderiales bacterium]|jgi:diguanylate cyclase (GGDEF)-like protein/PAS domain S-box-containing protein